MQFNDPVLVATTSVSPKLAEIVKAVTGSNLFQHCDKNRLTQVQRDLVYLANRTDDVTVLLSSSDQVLASYHMSFAVLLVEQTYIRLAEYGKLSLTRTETTFDQIYLAKLTGNLFDIKHFVIDGSEMDNSFIQLIAKRIYDIACIQGLRALWGDYLVAPKQNHLRIEMK